MTACLTGCLGRVLASVVLLGILLLGWMNRDLLRSTFEDWRGADVAADSASPALAERAEEKLASLSARQPPALVAFGGAEVQSLVQFRIAHALPPYLIDPRIDLEGSTMRIDARVPSEQMPSLPGAAELTSLLPDTTDVTARGMLLPLDSGRVALAIDEMTAARIPLPARMIPGLLQRIGRGDEQGLPEDAVPLRLPAGACTAYIRADSLVLVGATSGKCN